MIKGKITQLRPSTRADMRFVHASLNASDITHFMMGPPTFPDHPPSRWEEFRAEWEPYYFDGSAPGSGRCFIITAGRVPVGIVVYNEIDPQTRRVEIDIWMTCEENCGKGYGPDALRSLCDYLFRVHGVQECWLQPSARNPRAIRAYEKTGFRRVDISPEDMESQYGKRDYHDSVLLVMPVGSLRAEE